MAWALKQRFDWGDAFLGYGYAEAERPIEFQGMVRLAFATRKAARHFITTTSWYANKPRAVQVDIVLQERKGKRSR